jgi:hypothetical protein
MIGAVAVTKSIASERTGRLDPFFPSVFDEIEENIKNLFPKIQNLGKYCMLD